LLLAKAEYFQMWSFSKKIAAAKAPIWGFVVFRIAVQWY